MRYWALVISGLLIAGASIVAVDWALYHLVRIGTCASGGPYVSARPCPPGTEKYILALTGGIFTGLIGAGIWAARGGPHRHSPVGLGLALWSLLFFTLAASTALAAFGPAHNDDNEGAKTAAIILGIVFVPMAVLPLPFSIFANRMRPSGKRVADLVARGEMAPPPIARPPSPPSPAAPAVPSTWPGFKPVPQGDPADRIKKLSDLLAKGLISNDEYEKAKKQILGGM